MDSRLRTTHNLKVRSQRAHPIVRKSRCLLLAFISMLFLSAVFAELTTPIFSITDFVTCESARTNAPHDWHVPQSQFPTTADRFFAWVELTDVDGTHPVEMKLYRPDGAFYGQETQQFNETNGVANWWRMVAWWKIQGENLAQTPGRWRLDLLVDAVLQRSISLDIIPATAAPAMAGPGALAERGAAAPVTSTQPLASQPAGTWILQSSSDLLHWTDIQTNALPSAGSSDRPSAPTVLRLTPGGRGAGTWILEASTDSLNWVPLKTNNLPVRSSLDVPSAGTATARFYRALLPEGTSQELSSR
jgi:hypothetical protein